MGFRTKGVLTFLLISFGLKWTAILVAHFGFGLSIGDPQVQLLIAIPTAFSPAIAAVIVRAWVTREGFRDARLPLRVRTAWFYYLLAWLGPVLVLTATVGLAVAARLYRPDFSSPQDLLSVLDLNLVGLLLVLAAPIILMPLFWGEEFGWRSYLQLRVGRSPLRAVLLTGIIWAGWHVPLVFTDYSDYPNPFLGMAVWALLLMAQDVILGWLFLRSGSVWVACLAHAGNNMVIGTLATPVLVDEAGLDPYTAGLLQLVPLAAVCAWILLTGRLQPSQDADACQPVAAAVRGTHA